MGSQSEINIKKGNNTTQRYKLYGPISKGK